MENATTPSSTVAAAPVPIREPSKPIALIALALSLGLVIGFIAGSRYAISRSNPGSMKLVPPIEPSSQPTETGLGTICTMEAKICPDGSAVGRSGPNCEFAECPEVAPLATYSATPTATSSATSSGRVLFPTY